MSKLFCIHKMLLKYFIVHFCKIIFITAATRVAYLFSVILNCDIKLLVLLANFENGSANHCLLLKTQGVPNSNSLFLCVFTGERTITSQ